MHRFLLCALAALLLAAPAPRLRAADDDDAKDTKTSAATATAEKENEKDKAKKSGDESDESAEAKPRAAKKVRLAHIVIEGALPESAGEMTLFGDLGIDLRKNIARLDKAAEDDSVAGVVLVIEANVGRGKLNELREAVKRVQGKGKKVYALLEGAMGPQYQLAAACDEIILPESGELLIPGVRAEFAFYKDMFAKLGIEADMLHVGDYKGASEPYTRDSLSEPVRKNMTALIDDLYDDMLSTIASDRKLKVDDVKKAVDQGMILAKEAKELGLIDRVAYADEFRAALADEYNTDKLVFVENYAKTKIDADFSGPMGMMKLFETVFSEPASKNGSGAAKIALVYCVGPIMSGKSQSSLFGDTTMGSTTIVEALQAAAKDDSVKAIVMRVDSPGGSALASDLIWRQTQTIKKPIVVSMGDVAASGGYYISMGADRIFAEPGTVTGSIGVVGGKLSLKGLYNWIGVDTETISRGENSGIFSETEKFSPSERKIVEQMMKTIYGQFTSKAAKGRDMDPDKLESLAGGQVYTGRVAKRNGLIDEIGTLRDAIQAAKRLAGLDAEQKYELKLLPEQKNPFEELFGAGSSGEKETRLSGAVAGLLQFAPQLRGPLRHAAQLQQVMREPIVLMMPYSVEIK
jgi:protease-4